MTSKIIMILMGSILIGSALSLTIVGPLGGGLVAAGLYLLFSSIA